MTTFADVGRAMRAYMAAKADWQEAATEYLKAGGWWDDHGMWHHDTRQVHYVDTLEAVADQYVWECKEKGVEA